MRINFNVPPYTGKEFDYIKECVENQKICGDGPYTAKDNEWIEKKTGVTKALLTTSCTHATEMAAFLADIKDFPFLRFSGMKLTYKALPFGSTLINK